MSKQDILFPEGNRSAESLTRLQKLPLEQKINLSERRIKQFYESQNGMVSVSFSGGKDSTVLLHLVRSLYPEIKAVFFDTGLEFPEIREFVKTIDNVDWIRPKMNFKIVLEKYGYPIPSKDIACAVSRYRNTKSDQQKYYRMHGFPNGKKGMIPDRWKFLINSPFNISEKCCDVLKKRPANKYSKETGLYPIIGTMAEESRLRMTNWIKNGCNVYSGKIKSMPLSFWTESDVWEYIRTRNIEYSECYNMGYKRTGCIYCLFGHFQQIENGDSNRFKLLKKTHPKQYKYCMENLGLDKVLTWIENELYGVHLPGVPKKYDH